MIDMYTDGERLYRTRIGHALSYAWREIKKQWDPSFIERHYGGVADDVLVPLLSPTHFVAALVIRPKLTPVP